MKAVFRGALVCLAVAAWLAPPARTADRIYWTDETESAIAFANLDGSGGGELSISGTTVSAPEGVAIDAAAGRLYWVNYSGPDPQRVSFAKLDGSGGADLNTAGATVDSPYGIAVDPTGGRVFWANAPAGPDDISFARIDGSGGDDLNTSGTTELDNPLGVAVDSTTGRVYWANTFGGAAGTISYANLDGSGGDDINTAGATVKSPVGVAVDSAAGRVYWANSFLNAGISYANLDGSGGDDINTSGATLNNPYGVAIDTEAGRIYWANTSPPVISYANLDGSGGDDLNTVGAPPGEASFPALLKRPSGAGVPEITVDPKPGSLLSCSQGIWAPDVTGAFLSRAPQSLAFQWAREGTNLQGATTDIFAPHSVGSYTCTVTATNAAGSALQVGSTTIERARIRGLAVKPRALTPMAGRGPSAVASKRGKRRKPGARVSFRLNEGAMVAFKVKQRRRSRRGRPARFVRLPGGFSRVGRAGRNSFRFTGRLRKRRLKPGRYLLVATPTGVGRAGRSRSAGFRVK
jgi:hypothetical protein